MSSLLEVPAEYDGPHLDNGQVTEEFMRDMLTAFKDQKKLHQKYAYQVSTHREPAENPSPCAIGV